MFFFPSPLVGEGGRDAKHRGRVRGYGLSMDRNPSSGTDFVHLLPQGEKGRKRPRPAPAVPYRNLNRTNSLVTTSHHWGRYHFHAPGPAGPIPVLPTAGGKLRERNHAYCCEPPCHHQSGVFYGVGP